MLDEIKNNPEVKNGKKEQGYLHAIISAYLFFTLFSGLSACLHNANIPVGSS